MISVRAWRAHVAPPATRSALLRNGSRSLSSAITKASETDILHLYQYAICPFCNRVKAFLDYAGIKYEAVEVNPLTKAEIKWSKDYRKVPIAKLNNDPLFGSDAIIENLLRRPDTVAKLEDRWRSSSMTMDKFSSTSFAKDWTAYATNDLASLLYPNMCRTWSDSYRAFVYVNTVDTFGPFQRLLIRNIGSFAMYMAASKIKKTRNISDERVALNEILLKLETVGLGNGAQTFLSGADEPDLGDLAVFGTLRSLEGLPTHTEVVQERRGPIHDWYHRMVDKVDLGRTSCDRGLSLRQ